MFPKAVNPGSEGQDMTRSSAPADIFPGTHVFPGTRVGNRMLNPLAPGRAPMAPGRARPSVEGRVRRPGPQRPALAATRYRGTGVRMSTAPHRSRPAPRPVTPFTVVALALLAGVITIWLGAVAQFGQALQDVSGPVPDKLAVVQVKSGESLQRVAARVAPDAPVASVVERIRELNKLDTAVLDAGQTLLAPIG